MTNITFLAPLGATFSHDAYKRLSEIYLAPDIDSQENHYLGVASNSEVLPTIIKDGGFGTIAMETLAEGRVPDSVESYTSLLQQYKKTADCPIQITGAIKMKLHFCLMVRKEMVGKPFRKIIAHAKSIGACKSKIAENVFPTEATKTSNGEAARRVAEEEADKDCAALGPKSAAEKYDLVVINEAFEDTAAITTFFLISPAGYQVWTDKKNRALVVFRLPHQPDALATAIHLFGKEGLNLIQIHSVPTGNHTYDFIMEMDVEENQIESFERAKGKLEQYTVAHVCFGPFPVVTE